MANGYMGKIMNVKLTDGTLAEETLSEDLCRDYIGGYGIGARLLYERIPAGADPLGPENIMGFLTGSLTGTPALIGSRFVVVGKSPKTGGGWGDANCGGFFGPHLKFAGAENQFNAAVPWMTSADTLRFDLPFKPGLVAAYRDVVFRRWIIRLCKPHVGPVPHGYAHPSANSHRLLEFNAQRGSKELVSSHYLRPVIEQPGHVPHFLL